VPFDDRVGLHNGQGGASVRPTPRQQHPEDAIAWSQLRSSAGFFENGHLLSQCKVFDGHGSTADEERPKEEKDGLSGAHGLSLPPVPNGQSYWDAPARATVGSVTLARPLQNFQIPTFLVGEIGYLDASFTSQNSKTIELKGVAPVDVVEVAVQAINDLYQGHPVTARAVGKSLGISEIAARHRLQKAVAEGSVITTARGFAPPGSEEADLYQKVADAVKALFNGSPVCRADVAAEPGLSETQTSDALRAARLRGLVACKNRKWKPVKQRKRKRG